MREDGVSIGLPDITSLGRKAGFLRIKFNFRKFVIAMME